MLRMAPPTRSSPISQRTEEPSLPPVFVRSTNSPKMSEKASLIAPDSPQ